MKTGTVFCCAVIAVFCVVLSSPAQTTGPPVKECEFIKQREQSRLDNYHGSIRSPLDFLPGGAEHSDYALTAIVPDFQISENGGYADAGGVVWAQNDAGLGVAVWDDGRSGGSSIMAQLFINNEPLGTTFIVDQFGGYFLRCRFDAAVTNNNCVVFIYTFGAVCYVKVYNSAGQVQVDRFCLWDLESGSYSNIHLAVDTTGRAVAVWRNRRDSFEFSIYGRWFTTDGASISDNVCMSGDLSVEYSGGFDVACTGDGTALAVWTTDFDTDSSGIGACIWAAGTAVPAVPVIISNYENYPDNFYPAVSTDGNATYSVGWRSYKYEVYSYLSRYVIKTFELNGDSLTEKQVKRLDDSSINGMKLSMNSSGNVLAAGNDILYLDKNLIINPDCYSIYLDDNVNAMDAKLSNHNQSIFFWRNRDALRSRAGDYVFQSFDWNGQAITEKVLIDSIPYGSCLQYDPQMAVFDDGGFVVTWADRRSGLDDYYLRCFDADGSPRGDAVQIFDWDGSFIHFHWHLLNADREGNIVVTAFRCGGDGKGYVCQRFSSDGVKLGDNVYLGYSDVGYLAYATAIDQNDFTLIWSQLNLYMQRFDNTGTAVGPQTQINETDGGIWTNWVEKKIQRVHTLNDGGFVAAWAGDWSEEKPAAIQRFAADGSRIGGNVFLTDDQEAPVACEPEILSDGDTLHYVLWSETDAGSTVYRAQRFDSGWAKAGNIITIGGLNSSTVWSIDTEGRISAVLGENGNIYGRCYGPDLQPAGSVFMINEASDADQSPPVFSELHNGRIYTAWADNRIPNTGFSIWGNVLEWTNYLDVPDADSPASFILSQNYPNPFNPGTTLEYTLPGPARVDLRIFDVRGRQIAVLTAGRKEAGTYTVRWNADGLPSGLYFARLQAEDEVRVRKMVLQK